MFNPAIATVFYTRTIGGGGRITPRFSTSRADRNEIAAANPKFSGSNFLMVVSSIFVNRGVQLQIQDGGRKVGKRKYLILGVCSSHYQDFAADFDIMKSRRSNGIKVSLMFDVIMYANQYGGRETTLDL